MRNGKLLTAGLALAVMLPLAGCGHDAPQQTAAKTPAGARMTAAVTDAPDWQSVSAEIATRNQAQVTARIPGILTSLSVQAGDTVRRGQVIGRITDNQLGYQAAAYGAQGAAAGAQAAQAQAELSRVRYLYQNGVYAKARLEQAEAAASAAGAQVGAARAQQSAVNAMAGQGAVVAPADGRVLRADVPAGSPVSPGMVVAVVTSGAVVLRLDLPEVLAAKVQPGAMVWVDGQDGLKPGQGSVVRVYPDVTSGQVRADVQFAGLDTRLIGRRVAAKLAAGTHRAMLVPRGYITTRYGIDYVTVLGKDGAGADVPVQTAPADGGQVQILSGVNPGDVLVGHGR